MPSNCSLIKQGCCEPKQVRKYCSISLQKCSPPVITLSGLSSLLKFINTMDTHITFGWAPSQMGSLHCYHMKKYMNYFWPFYRNYIAVVSPALLALLWCNFAEVCLWIPLNCILFQACWNRTEKLRRVAGGWQHSHFLQQHLHPQTLRRQSRKVSDSKEYEKWFGVTSLRAKVQMEPFSFGFLAFKHFLQVSNLSLSFSLCNTRTNANTFSRTRTYQQLLNRAHSLPVLYLNKANNDKPISYFNYVRTLLQFVTFRSPATFSVFSFSPKVDQIIISIQKKTFYYFAYAMSQDQKIVQARKNLGSSL